MRFLSRFYSVKSNSGITVLSFANKVVKVRSFFVPSTEDVTIDVRRGIRQHSSHSSNFKMMNKTSEELTRNQIQEWRTKCLDPATQVFKEEDARSTVDPLAQILEKLSSADHNFATSTATVNQQKEHLAAISAKADQQ